MAINIVFFFPPKILIIYQISLPTAHIVSKNSVSITKNVGLLLTLYMILQLSLISILKLGSILYIKHSFSGMIVTIQSCTKYDVLAKIGYVTPMPT